MGTLLKGDPEEGSVLLDTAKEVLSSVLPGQLTDGASSDHDGLGAVRAGADRAPKSSQENTRLPGMRRTSESVG